ncbi:MAG: glutamyl-tRNA reductase [Thermoplasmatota archaeon]
MGLLSVHATHQTTPLAELERVSKISQEDLLRDLVRDPAIHEALLLATCNRFEVYVAAPDPVAAHAALFTVLSRFAILPTGIALLRDEASLEHLLRVASGIESLIVGEDQILGQVRDAYHLAQRCGTVGPELSHVAERALTIGKRVRSQTRLNRGAVSVGSAAVERAATILGGLDGKQVVLVGTGEMGRLVGMNLEGRNAAATVVAHSDLPAAEILASRLKGTSAPLSDLPRTLRGADLLVTAVSSSEPIVDAALLSTVARTSPHKLVILDLGNPRNVEPPVGAVPWVHLEDLDGLRRVADENRTRRHAEVAAAEAIIEAEITRERTARRLINADAGIGALFERAATIQEEELAKAFRMVDLSPAEQAIVRNLVASSLKRALGPAVEALRAAGETGDVDAVRGLTDALLGAGGAREPDPAPARPGSEASGSIAPEARNRRRTGSGSADAPSRGASP